MKIGTDAFKERVSQGIDNEFMRGAVSGAQERLRTRRLEAAEELGNWESGAHYQRKSGSMSLKTLISISDSLPKMWRKEADMSISRKLRKRRLLIFVMSFKRRTGKRL